MDEQPKKRHICAGLPAHVSANRREPHFTAQPAETQAASMVKAAKTATEKNCLLKYRPLLNLKKAKTFGYVKL